MGAPGLGPFVTFTLQRLRPSPRSPVVPFRPVTFLAYTLLVLAALTALRASGILEFNDESHI